jgi:hypothetical protein
MTSTSDLQEQPTAPELAPWFQQDQGTNDSQDQNRNDSQDQGTNDSQDQDRNQGTDQHADGPENEQEEEGAENSTQEGETGNAKRRLIGASVLLFSLTSDGLNVPCMLLARDSAAQWNGNRRDVYTDFGGGVNCRRREHRAAKKPTSAAQSVLCKDSSDDHHGHHHHHHHHNSNKNSKENDKCKDKDSNKIKTRAMNAEAVAAREFAEESLVGSIRYFQTSALNHPASLRINVEQSLLRKEYFARLTTNIGKDKKYVTFLRQIPFQRHVCDVFNRQRELLLRSTTHEFHKLTQEQRQFVASHPAIVWCSKQGRPKYVKRAYLEKSGVAYFSFATLAAHLSSGASGVSEDAPHFEVRDYFAQRLQGALSLLSSTFSRMIRVHPPASARRYSSMPLPFSAAGVPSKRMIVSKLHVLKKPPATKTKASKTKPTVKANTPKEADAASLDSPSSSSSSSSTSSSTTSLSCFYAACARKSSQTRTASKSTKQKSGTLLSRAFSKRLFVN